MARSREGAARTMLQLSRPAHLEVCCPSLQPPGGTNPTITAYSDSTSGSTVTVTRRSSVTTASLDGFGRPIATVNSVGVRTITQYDPEGRVIKEPQPFVDTDTGATITYDELGRIRRRTHADGSYSERSYGPGTVTIRDENGRATTQSRQAFGHPDDARLVAVTDAATQTWQYSYNAVGSLETVTAPDGTNRQWQYNSSNQLVSEIHPESGTTGMPTAGIGCRRRRMPMDSSSCTPMTRTTGCERLP
jgi:YD repeat-containing protein